MLSPFTSIPTGSIILSPAEQDQVDKVSAIPHQGALQYATVSALASWIGEGDISFTVPGQDSVSFQSHPMMVHYDSELSYSYIGKIEGAAHGNFAISRDSEGITGFIQLSTEYYSFYPLSGTRIVMIKDPETLLGQCAMDGSEGGSVLEDFCNPEDNDCPALIDIAAWVHPGAFSAVPVGFGTMAKMQFEAILANSRIFNKRVRVSVYQLPFQFTLSADIITDVQRLVNSQQAQNFKNASASDIVVLLTNQNYGGGTTFGFAKTIGAGNLTAFAIVEAPAALGGRFTFVHECAHLLGAHHNRSANGGNDDENDCAHGLRYTGISGVIRRTVMATAPAGGIRIPFFSNPNVSFDGFPTGIDGNGTVAAYNAKKVRNFFCAADDFKTPKRLYTIIVGPQTLCATESQTYQAITTEGNYGIAPFTTTWTFSTTPNGTYTSLPTVNGNSVSVSTSLGSLGGSIYLRVLVTGSDGITYTETIRIAILPTYCSLQGGGEDRERDRVTAQSNSLVLVPNPVRNVVSIISQQDNRLIHQVEIFNALGQRVEATTYQPQGVSQIQINVSGLTPGLYFARSKTSKGSLQNTFILQH